MKSDAPESCRWIFLLSVGPTFIKNSLKCSQISIALVESLSFILKVSFLLFICCLFIICFKICHVFCRLSLCFWNNSLRWAFSALIKILFNLFLYCLYNIELCNVGLICIFIYNLFLFLIESFKAGVSQGFLLLYFFLILTIGNAL